MSIFDLANHRKIRIGKLTRLHFLYLLDKTRNLHVRIAGEPGTGKTMLAAYIAFQDALREIPLIVIDGKGQLINTLIKLIVSSQNKDELLARFVYVPFNRTDYVHGFPFFHRSDRLDAYNASQAFIEVVMRVNPSLEQVATTLRQIGTASLMAIYEMGWQITEVLSFLHDNRVRKRVLDEVGERIPGAVEFFHKTYDRWPYQYQRDRRLSFETKVWPFCLSSDLRAVVGQSRPTISFEDLDQRKYILCLDLSGMAEYPFLLIGTSFIDRLGHYIFKSRGLHNAAPVSLIVDEAPQLLSYQGIEKTFSRFQGVAREYQLWMTICHQNMNQLEPGIRKSFWSISNHIIGRQLEFDSALETVKNMVNFDPFGVKYEAQKDGQYPHDLEVTEQDRVNLNWIRQLCNRYFLVRLGTDKVRLVTTPTLRIDHVTRQMVRAEKLRSLKTFARPYEEVMREVDERINGPVRIGINQKREPA